MQMIPRGRRDISSHGLLSSVCSYSARGFVGIIILAVSPALLKGRDRQRQNSCWDHTLQIASSATLLSFSGSCTSSLTAAAAAGFPGGLADCERKAWTCSRDTEDLGSRRPLAGSPWQPAVQKLWLRCSICNRSAPLFRFSLCLLLLSRGAGWLAQESRCDLRGSGNFRELFFIWERSTSSSCN